MNYQEADAKLTGRCSTSRKLENNTYLERRSSFLADKTIAVRLHRTNILTFYPDGRIKLCTGGYSSVTTHDRLNTYLPRPYRVYGEPVRNNRTGNDGATVLSDGRGHECLVNSSASINADGTIEGGDVEAYRQRRSEDRNAANRVRGRARYWARKARGIFVDRSQCTKQGAWGCNLRSRWQRRELRI